MQVEKSEEGQEGEAGVGESKLTVNQGETKQYDLPTRQEIAKNLQNQLNELKTKMNEQELEIVLVKNLELEINRLSGQAEHVNFMVAQIKQQN